MEARCFFRALNRCNACKDQRITYIISNFIVVFDHEDLGQVLAGFPSTIVIYNDPCIVVLNQVCQIHSEIYQSKHLGFSDSHLQMCLLILIILIYLLLSPPGCLEATIFGHFCNVFGEVSGEDQRTLWLRHARGT